MLINYILPAMMPTSPPMQLVDPEPNFLNQYSGQYLHEPSKTKVDLVVEKNSLVLYQQKLFHTEKIQLLPLADNIFYGTSEDKGELYFTFVRDDKYNIT